MDAWTETKLRMQIMNRREDVRTICSYRSVRLSSNYVWTGVHDG